MNLNVDSGNLAMKMSSRQMRLAFSSRFLMLQKEYDRHFQNLVVDIVNDDKIWANSPDLFDSEAENPNNPPRDELEWTLRDLKTIDLQEKTEWTEVDRAKIKHLEEDLKAATSSDKLSEFPAVTHEAQAKKLLSEIDAKVDLPQLTAQDLQKFLPDIAKDCPSLRPRSGPVAKPGGQHVETIPSVLRPFPPPPPHLTFHDYVMHADANDGKGKCCSLDSPSCLLTTALVCDRLQERLRPTSSCT